MTPSIFLARHSQYLGDLSASMTRSVDRGMPLQVTRTDAYRTMEAGAVLQFVRWLGPREFNAGSYALYLRRRLPLPGRSRPRGPRRRGSIR
jgi:hypothetical protein